MELRTSGNAAASILENLRPCLFWVTTLFGASIFWMAHHPPMGDLAQHAAQVALLRDLLAGTSAWSDIVRINLGTPYLIGYGLALPLSLFFSVTAALKILMSAAYILFVWAATRIREHLGGAPRLDWFFIPGFFGFAWAYGFMTFLVAAPLVLALIYLSDQHARHMSWKSGTRLLLAALLLLVSHGLAFCFGWVTAMALVIARRKQWANTFLAVGPLLLPLLPFVAYVLHSQQMKLELFGATPPSEIYWMYSRHRLAGLLRDTLTGTGEDVFSFIALAMMSTPWLMGLRVDLRNPSRYLPFLVTVLVLLFVPQLAMDTWGLYPRFAMFLMPTYAWMFSESASMRRRAQAGESFLALVSIGLLCLYGIRSIHFDNEEADFRKILAVTQPSQLALGLIYDKASPATRHWNSYAHTAAWYQAEKHGFVDFNFAWYPPQVVRFRSGKTPMVRYTTEAHPEQFQWVRDKGELYRYFFVRTHAPEEPGLFADFPCPPALLARSGPWSVYERRSCGQPVVARGDASGIVAN